MTKTHLVIWELWENDDRTEAMVGLLSGSALCGRGVAVSHQIGTPVVSAPVTCKDCLREMEKPDKLYEDE